MKKTLLITIISTTLLLAGNSPYDGENLHQNHSNLDKVLFIWDMYDAYESEKKRQENTEEKRLKKLNNSLNKKAVVTYQEKNITNKEFAPTDLQKKHFNQNQIKVNDKNLYPFTLLDSNLQYFSMRQANEIAINSMLFISDYSNKLLAKYTDNIFLKILLNLALGIAYEESIDIWAHEEGHRSILTYHNISSNNAWKDGAVDGVKTQTLNDFKRDNFVDFIRLHTAGIESEAVLIEDFEERLMFEKHLDISIYVPLWTHKYINYAYMHSADAGDGMHYDKNDNYNNYNELMEPEKDRDIVGHDVYGFVRHLFTKNDVNYKKRYSNIDEFTPEQKSYHDKIVSRAWINFLDMNLFRMLYDKVDFYGYDVSAGFNYYLSPFGDVTDLNIITSSKESKNRLTLRKMDNYDNSFYAIQLKDYRRNFGDFWLTSTVNIWQNPKKFDFFTSEKFYGGSLSCNIEYKINDIINISTRLLTKSKGFLPGVNDDNLKAMSSISAGIVIKY